MKQARAVTILTFVLLLAAACSGGQAAPPHGAGGPVTPSHGAGGPVTPSHGAGVPPHSTGVPRGTVTGTLVLTGGPIQPGGQQPGSRPIEGTVEFRRTGYRLITAHAGRSGTFSASLPTGTYQAVAHSRRVLEVSGGTMRQPPCSQPQRVKVTAGRRTTITVSCIVP